MVTRPLPLYLEALKTPSALGWPENPYLRLPILAWISLDPSDEAQRLVCEIWDGLPEEVRHQAGSLWGVKVKAGEAS
jgi:hypothetical protein